MPDPDLTLSSSEWSEYWASGSLHSCATSFQGNYGGAIAAFWREVFAQDGERASRILDLATGNGALPKLVTDLCSADVYVIDAVDAADVLPQWVAEDDRSRIRFHCRVPLEALPFDDGTFDLVTSQYGIEYARWPEAVAEAVRVCRAGGRIALVVHHAGSVVADVGRQEIANFPLLLEGDGLLACAMEVLPWLSLMAGSAVPGIERNTGDSVAARERYNQAMQRIATALPGNRAPDLLLSARQQIHALVAAVGRGDATVSTATEAVVRYRDALAASLVRTSQMLASAKTRTQIDALVDCGIALCPGAEAQVVELRQPEGLLAWGVVVSLGR